MPSNNLWHPNTATEKELSKIERLATVGLIVACVPVIILFLWLISKIL